MKRITSIILSLSLLTNVLYADNKQRIFKKDIPISKALLSIENGGNLSAADAFSDGIGLVTVGDGDRQTFAMNNLVFNYGNNAKENNMTLKEYVINSDKTTQEEKDLANLLGTGYKIDSIIGESCNDNNSLTGNDIYIDTKGTCLGTIIKTENKCFGDVIGSEFLFNNNSYLVVDNSTIKNNLGRAATLCTSNVTTMNSLFKANINFNEDISSWDTSNVTDMSSMFYDAWNFNQSIGIWDVSKVTNMNSMFSQAKAFSEPLNGWDTSNVTNMANMFQYTSFNRGLNNWNTSKVTTMAFMFYTNNFFNKNINSWNTSNVTDMSYMFSTTQNFNQPLNNWNTSKVTNMVGMFSSTKSFNQNINDWNVSNVTNMTQMFNVAALFDQPLDKWDVSKVNNMEYMFRSAYYFNQNLRSWNVDAVTNYYRFKQYSPLIGSYLPMKSDGTILQ